MYEAPAPRIYTLPLLLIIAKIIQAYNEGITSGHEAAAKGHLVHAMVS